MIALAGRGLATVLLVGALVLPFPGGYPLAYLLIATTLLLSLWLLPARMQPSVGPAALLLALAFALITIAFMASGDLAFSINFLMLMLLAPLATALSRQAAPANALVVARLALLGAALAAAISSWEVFVLGHVRAAGFGSDSIWSAQSAVILGFLALIGLPQATPQWRLLLWSGPLLGLVTAFLAGSRGPLLAVPLLLVVAGLLATRRRWLALGTMAAIGATALVIAGIFSPANLERLTAVTSSLEELASGDAVSEISTGQRLAFYRAAFDAFLAQPLTGYGWGGKIAAVAPYLPDGGAMLAEGHHHLHSDILNFGVSAGVFGLLAYFLVLAAPVAGALASPRDAQYRARLLGASLLSVGYFACGLSYLMFGYEFHTTLFVCLTAILLGYCRDAPALPPGR